MKPELEEAEKVAYAGVKTVIKAQEKRIQELEAELAEARKEVERLGNLTVGDTESFKISKMNIELQAQVERLEKEKENIKSWGQHQFELSCNFEAKLEQLTKENERLRNG